MEFSFLSQFGSAGIAIVMFALMFAVHLIAYRTAHRHKDKKLPEGFEGINGPLLGLLALLLGFSFAAASARFEMRRHVLVDEANAIARAIHVADLYPEAERQHFRADLDEYVEARIAFFDAGMDGGRINEITLSSSEISHRIWQRAARLAHDPNNLISSQQMVPALTEMIDIVRTRNAARQATVPDSILWMLFIMCLVGSFIVGFGRKETRHAWLASAIFALMISLCISLIIDLDRPSHGMITLEATNKHVVDLRELFDDDH